MISFKHPGVGLSDLAIGLLLRVSNNLRGLCAALLFGFGLQAFEMGRGFFQVRRVPVGSRGRDCGFGISRYFRDVHHAMRLPSRDNAQVEAKGVFSAAGLYE